MRKIVLLAFTFFLAYVSFAQENRWTFVNESTVQKNLFANKNKPKVYELVSLNEVALKSDLKSVPNEQKMRIIQSGFVITVPVGKNKLEHFKIVDAPVIEAGLAVKYPGLKSYAGIGIEDPSSYIRFSFTPQGLNAIILSATRKIIYISPIDQANQLYTVVSRNDLQNTNDNFKCLTTALGKARDNSNIANRNADDATLRKYRLAMCAAGEFSQFWLNGSETTDAQRKAKVLAAQVSHVTTSNAIYERDFGIRMILVANNDAVIYLNASTDPFSDSNGWNDECQATIDNVIGNANYDIGHLQLRSGNNGNAGCIGCVCQTGSKGSGWTAYSDLSSPFYVVDYLTHEMGHQFGGNHTFAFSYEGTSAQCEPGSGSTIMGYAGITGSTDVQPHSDPYFHASTIQQVTDYIKTASGGCSQNTATGNNVPTANAGANYTIPRSTPFILTGTGADADAADVLTYCWEQINPRSSSSPTTPSATATAGPVFRSFNPSTTNSRSFPQLSSILSGTNANSWEVLPSVARTLNFRFTVRDNHAGGGSNKSADISVSIAGTAGPFTVTAPNTAVNWAVGSTQDIGWSVNGTNATPVNCANVKISLSTDGGNSFPIVLASSTPNDGTETITIPGNVGTTCRIKIEAVGNVFFDISNANFTISGTAPACATPVNLTTSSTTTNSATVSWAAVTGANNYTVEYKTVAEASWTTVASATTATSASLTGLTAATDYNWRVRANCASASSSFATANFTTNSATTTCATPASLVTASITVNSAIISWAAVTGANNYTVEYKTAAATAWTTAALATTATTASLSGLTAATAYNWRVRANCASASSSFISANFTTINLSTACPGSYDNSSNGTVAGAPQIPFNTDIKGLINSSTDNDYYKFVITTGGTATITLTTLPLDYDIRLYSSNGTSQLAISQNGSNTSETITRTFTAGTYYLRVYGYNGANNATSCYTLKVATGTATKNEAVTNKLEKVSDKLSIYPSPVKQQLYINGIAANAKAQIFDITGRNTSKVITLSGSNSINVQSLSPGIYFITITSTDGKILYQNKFIKE